MADKIQSLRTSFRKEVRKMKKSQSTGSGTNDIYVPKWKYYEQCKFLEDVILSSRATVSNISPFSYLNDLDGDDYDDGVPKENNPQQTNKPVSPDIQHPTKKKRSVSWMETAANALNDLAKTAMNQQMNGKYLVRMSPVQSAVLEMCICSARPSLPSSKDFSRYHAEPTPPFATQPLQYGHINGQGSEIFNYQPLQSVHCRYY